jgi:hypothetical protein
LLGSFLLFQLLLIYYFHSVFYYMPFLLLEIRDLI